MRLSNIQEGESSTVRAVHGHGPIRSRLMDMGFSFGAIVDVVRKAPMGGPIEVKIKGTLVSLRPEEAMMVDVTPLHRKHGQCHRRRHGFFRSFMNLFENDSDGEK